MNRIELGRNAALAVTRTKGSGKWRDPSVPNIGWSCVEVDDYEDDHITCEMCESREIRYVHFMTHPHYVGTLRCGCHCADIMEGGRGLAKAREANYKSEQSAARAREKWIAKLWKISKRGNEYLRTDDHCFTIYRKPDGAIGLAIMEEEGRTRFDERFSEARLIKAYVYDCYVRPNR